MEFRVGGRRPGGRPRKTWLESVEADMAKLEIDKEDVYDRSKWRRNVNVMIQNPFLTAQSTQIKSVISVPIKDFINHYPRALFNDIPRVGSAHFYDIPGPGRSLTTYPGQVNVMKRKSKPIRKRDYKLIIYILQ